MLPHLAEEAWQQLGSEGLVADQPWPTHDPALLIDDEVTIVVQVSGKVRDKIHVPKGQSQSANVSLAMSSSKVSNYIGEEKPDRVIYVTDRLINFIPAPTKKATE